MQSVPGLPSTCIIFGAYQRKRKALVLLQRLELLFVSLSCLVRLEEGQGIDRSDEG